MEVQIMGSHLYKVVKNMGIWEYGKSNYREFNVLIKPFQTKFPVI